MSPDRPPREGSETLPVAPPSAPRCIDGHCVTCADEGIPMRVIDPGGEDRGLAICEGEDGEPLEVMTALVKDVAPGDLLLVHAGTALIKLSAQAGEVP